MLWGLGSRKKVHPNFFDTLNNESAGVHQCLPMPASACQKLYMVRWTRINIRLLLLFKNPPSPYFSTFKKIVCIHNDTVAVECVSCRFLGLCTLCLWDNNYYLKGRMTIYLSGPTLPWNDIAFPELSVRKMLFWWTEQNAVVQCFSGARGTVRVSIPWTTKIWAAPPSKPACCTWW